MTQFYNGEKIIIHFNSDRQYWGFEGHMAHFEDYDPSPIDNETPSDSKYGTGFTEQEAIDNLIEQMEE